MLSALVTSHLEVGFKSEVLNERVVDIRLPLRQDTHTHTHIHTHIHTYSPSLTPQHRTHIRMHTHGRSLAPQRPSVRTFVLSLADKITQTPHTRLHIITLTRTLIHPYTRPKLDPCACAPSPTNQSSVHPLGITPGCCSAGTTYL